MLSWTLLEQSFWKNKYIDFL